jgi:diguanylate cyclase (GGDEF)-like protein/PAS domain S-box-containing protein
MATDRLIGGDTALQDLVHALTRATRAWTAADLPERLGPALAEVAAAVEIDALVLQALDRTERVSGLWSSAPLAGPGPADVGAALADHLPTAIELLRAGLTVPLPDVSRFDLTPVEQAALDGAGARSLLQVPLVDAGRLVGLLSAVGSHPRDHWPRDLAAWLDLVGRLLLSRIDGLQRGQTEAHYRARALALAHYIPDAVLVTGPDGDIRWATPATESVLGWHPADLSGQDLRTLLDDDGDAGRLAALTADLLATGMPVNPLEVRVRTGGGDRLWAEVRLALVRLDQVDGAPFAFGVPEGLDEIEVIAAFRDVHVRRLKLDRLTEQVVVDPLTGVANRAGLHAALTTALDPVADAGAVLFCDLDGFKAVNDTYGHDAGDEVLRVIAGRLRAAVRDHDVVARLGGDEFVVVLAGTTPAAVEDVARRIGRTIARPVPWRDAELVVTASIGCARHRPHDDPHHLLQAADQAMYAVKHAGRNDVRVV